MRPTVGRGGGLRGFTLVEVTVVVTIICILAAILFPVFARAREKARQARCLGNLQQISLALSMYARDHHGHFPPTNDDLTPLLGRYLPMEEVLYCPSRPLAADAEAGLQPPPVDYFYRAGFCDDDDPGTLLVCDSELKRHNEGANALMADGHARWLKFPYSRPAYAGATKDPWEPILRERKEYVPQPSPEVPGGVPGGAKAGGPP
jgi:prepilin-type N-terminal cleavage/methylation domain-containing protein/prepilin-type processing-associated H-X9-DG protein